MPSKASSTARPVIVTFPVFSTLIVYATVSPTLSSLVLSALFVTLIDEAISSIFTLSDASYVFSLSVAVTVFVKLPAAISTGLITYVAVVVTIPPAPTSSKVD